ncbi:hypothetical protein BaRGS_00012585 [Batillaria attramentaria]|uniref:Uncharacterized protein n=1 Tax=Batillaria attramentaria TaxID=370345 RepID=A0ABD0L9Y7_9CAEN
MDATLFHASTTTRLDLLTNHHKHRTKHHRRSRFFSFSTGSRSAGASKTLFRQNLNHGKDESPVWVRRIQKKPWARWPRKGRQLREGRQPNLRLRSSAVFSDGKICSMHMKSDWSLDAAWRTYSAAGETGVLIKADRHEGWE